MTIVRNLWPVVVVAVLAGCASSSKTPEEAAGAGDSAATGAASSGISDGGLGQGSAASGSALGGPTAAKENRVIYFDYDSFTVKAEYNPVIQANAKYLIANPAARVRLEGNADERGSREYNIGLGEKRAQAVRNSLMLQGAASDQISTVSYGEERPAVTGSDEEAYSVNRRVEIVYGQ